MKKLLFLCLTLFISITLAACGTGNDNDTGNDPTNDANTNDNVNEDVDTNDTNADSTNENDSFDLTSAALSVEEAINVFQENFPDTSISSIQLEEEHGELVYDIDGYDDTTEYSAEISQAGEVIAQEQEQKEADDQYNELMINDYITAEEALSAASEASETNGITPRSWSLEFENGNPIYEINFEDPGSQEVEVYIDAQSGEQLHVEVDD
ncbi:PepSY domain-containing protein [Amphibacillus sp. Q70]|uniref:PepSY domain-containing protein n=1 Tax=Amphibacillus sp. Q70 TaxID=3453416 RepID=UPI003F86FA96